MSSTDLTVAGTIILRTFTSDDVNSRSGHEKGFSSISLAFCRGTRAGPATTAAADPASPPEGPSAAAAASAAGRAASGPAAPAPAAAADAATDPVAMTARLSGWEGKVLLIT